jgi:hypothetical protein
MAAVAARVPSPGSDAGVHRRLGCGALVRKVCGVLTSDVIGQVGIGAGIWAFIMLYSWRFFSGAWFLPRSRTAPTAPGP